jgi:hypothetical protein
VIEGVVGDVYVYGLPARNLCRVLGPGTMSNGMAGFGWLDVKYLLVLDDGARVVSTGSVHQPSLLNWRLATDTEALAARLRYGL